MEETNIIILIIGILILILYFSNFSGKNDIVPKSNQESALTKNKLNTSTENFGSCRMSQQSVNEPIKLTQITQPVDATGKASLKVHVALWCGWSKKLIEQLNSDEFKNKFKNIENICILEIIDCEANKEVCDQSNVKGFPTIILQTKSGKNILYTGNRTTDNIINFIKANSL